MKAGMKKYHLAEDTIRLLVKIKKWLVNETFQEKNKKRKISLVATRLKLDNILNRGYYTNDERELLNELRERYINANKQN